VSTLLRPTVRRAERQIKAVARERCPHAQVFSFGAIDIDPRFLAVWITTETDLERDRLEKDEDLLQRLRAALLQAGYPADAVPLVGFSFESQETVNRDYGGNWWYRVK
jgi:hypothetical protein